MARKQTKQSIIYDEYINSDLTLKQLAEKYGITYGTCQQMLYKERLKRGVAVEKRH